MKQNNVFRSDYYGINVEVEDGQVENEITCL